MDLYVFSYKSLLLGLYKKIAVLCPHLTRKINFFSGHLHPLWVYEEKYTAYTPLLLQNKGAKREIFVYRPTQAPKQAIYPLKMGIKMKIFSYMPTNVSEQNISLLKAAYPVQIFHSLSVSMLRVRQAKSCLDIGGLRITVPNAVGFPVLLLEITSM